MNAGIIIMWLLYIAAAFFMYLGTRCTYTREHTWGYREEEKPWEKLKFPIIVYLGLFICLCIPILNIIAAIALWAYLFIRYGDCSNTDLQIRHFLLKQV